MKYYADRWVWQQISLTDLKCWGLLQVRDVLNGTLRFSRSILEDEGEISISDNHYQQVASPGSDLTEASNMAFSSIDSSKK